MRSNDFCTAFSGVCVRAGCALVGSPLFVAHRFAHLTTRDQLTPYPGKGLSRLRR